MKKSAGGAAAKTDKQANKSTKKPAKAGKSSGEKTAKAEKNDKKSKMTAEEAGRVVRFWAKGGAGSTTGETLEAVLAKAEKKEPAALKKIAQLFPKIVQCLRCKKPIGGTSQKCRPVHEVDDPFGMDDVKFTCRRCGDQWKHYDAIGEAIQGVLDGDGEDGDGGAECTGDELSCVLLHDWERQACKCFGPGTELMRIF